MKSTLRLKIGFFSILLSLTLILSRPAYFSALFLSVSLHELGHLVGARLCKIPIEEMKLGIFGAGITPKNSLYSYKQEIILCLFGPLANFLSAAAVSFFVSENEFINLFYLSSLALGTINLLPIESFDGGRIFLSLLSLRLSPALSHAIVSVISFVFIFTLWCLSVYFLLRAATSLSLFVFSAFLFSKIFIKDLV